MKRTLMHLIPALLAVFCALPALAAREFTPQSGLWMIPSENNGLPGRGFSLDVQGNTAFLQVFNYEKSGAATFHTAVGQLDESASMTVPLLRFKDGRYLGGPARDAVEDGSAGDVTVTFSDGLNGTIRFPGEEAQPISRFVVPEKWPHWWAQITPSPSLQNKEGWRHMQWTATNPDGVRHVWEAFLFKVENDRLWLGLMPQIDGDTSGGAFECRFLTDTQVFDCTTTRRIESGFYFSFELKEPPELQRLRFRVFGPDVVGVIQPTSNPTQRMTLNGSQYGSFHCNGAHCTGPNERSARVYVDSEFLYGTCITGYCGGYDNVTLIPSSGAWIIQDENTGRPGRGVFLDAQDDTIIVQTSDYLAAGHPTFHMGAGNLVGSRTFGEDTTTSLPLVRYKDGRYFGGPARSGTEAANDGDMRLSFSPRKEGRGSLDFGTGDITLPGEGTTRLHRLMLEPTMAGSMAHMLGEYLLIWNTAQGKRRQWVRLTRLEDVFAMNDDGTVQCYQGFVSVIQYSMTCALLPTPNIKQDWIGSASVTNVMPFHRNVPSRDFLMRTRDRHGNWLGLGAVNLPGLAIPQDQ